VLRIEHRLVAGHHHAHEEVLRQRRRLAHPPIHDDDMGPRAPPPTPLRTVTSCPTRTGPA
jgi:hypothetical protein